MRMECKCGEMLSNSFSYEIEYRIYSDDEWISIVENDKIISPILIPYPKHIAWKCPKCERIYLWKIIENSPMECVKIYKPEK